LSIWFKISHKERKVLRKENELNKIAFLTSRKTAFRQAQRDMRL